MNIIKEFEIQITAPSEDVESIAGIDKWLGFSISLKNHTVVFSLHSTPETEYTAQDILEQITPPKGMDFTGIPNTFLLYLAFVRRQVQDMDLNTPGTQHYFANNGNGYEVSTQFTLGPTAPKKPKIDGIISGCYWNVRIGLKYKRTGKSTEYQDEIFCIKPESAAHEAFDRMLRRNPRILDSFEVITPIEISKNKTELPHELEYTIVP